MEQLQLLLGGFAEALSPNHLLFLVIGAVLGTAVGVLPGLGSSMAVALLLPITFALDPTAAFIMFAAVYFGGLFGDSTAGILLNTRGKPPPSRPPSRGTAWPRMAVRQRRWPLPL